MTNEEYIEQYLEYLNSPEREKEAEEAHQRFIQAIQIRYDSEPDDATLYECPKDFSGTYVVSDNIQEIAGDAFRGCVGLNFIQLPDSLQEIGWGAF